KQEVIEQHQRIISMRKEEEQDQSYITAPKNEKPMLKERKNKTKDIKQHQRIMPMLEGGKSKTELYNSTKEQSQCLKKEQDQVIGAPKKKANANAECGEISSHHQCRMRCKANVEYESQCRTQKPMSNTKANERCKANVDQA
ncbi:2724_t:CDS:2, partial [Gigaspora rosea]